MQVPTICRMVHYRSYGTPGGEYPGTCRAAIVTAVDQYQPSSEGHEFLGHVYLCVLNPEGLFFNRVVFEDETPPSEPHKGGKWHWPSDCRDHA